MWTKNSDGSVRWSESAKLLLIELLIKNIDAISDDHQSLQKSKAWKHIYDGLIKAGMPKTSIDRVKKCWTRLKIAVKVQQTKRCGVQENSMLLSKKLNQAIIALLNVASCRGLMPKPKIKQEYIPDTWDKGMKESTPLEMHMNPVVRLNRLQLESESNQIVLKDHSNGNVKSSADYWNVMKKVAENDLKLKLLQYEHEQEKMEMEREIHQKNQVLLDLKINALNQSNFHG